MSTRNLGGGTSFRFSIVDQSRELVFDPKLDPLRGLAKEMMGKIVELFPEVIIIQGLSHPRDMTRRYRSSAQ